MRTVGVSDCCHYSCQCPHSRLVLLRQRRGEVGLGNEQRNSSVVQDVLLLWEKSDFLPSDVCFVEHSLRALGSHVMMQAPCSEEELHFVA